MKQTDLEAAVVAAFETAINRVGLAALKRTSMFGSTHRRIGESLDKAA